MLTLNSATVCACMSSRTYRTHIGMQTRMHVVTSSNHKFANVILLRLWYLLIIKLIITCANEIFNILVCLSFQCSCQLIHRLPLHSSILINCWEFRDTGPVQIFRYSSITCNSRDACRTAKTVNYSNDTWHLLTNAFLRASERTAIWNENQCREPEVILLLNIHLQYIQPIATSTKLPDTFNKTLHSTIKFDCLSSAELNHRWDPC